MANNSVSLSNKEIEDRVNYWRKLIEEAEADGLKDEASKIRIKLQSFQRDNPLKVPSEKCAKELEKLITQDEKMLELKKFVMTLCPYNDSVLIIGESGTGKEIIARALHGERLGKFMPINCAGLPEYLIESELFGHKRGAFTGADYDKEGLFQAANGGTLFLDEIGELLPNLQAKLLRVLQEGTFRRVGENEERQTTARVVAATHHNLIDLVKESKWRLDLYARLSTFTLLTIPIRHRRNDIKLIVDSLDKTGKCYESISWLDKDGNKIDVWNTQDFPLNVRDIQKLVRQWQVIGRVL